MFKKIIVCEDLYVDRDKKPSDSSYFLNLEDKSFELSLCKNKMIFVHVDDGMITIFDFKKEKYITYEYKNKEEYYDEHTDIVYKNKHLSFILDMENIKIIYKNNIYDDRKEIYLPINQYADDKGNDPIYYFCKKTKMIFFILNIQSKIGRKYFDEIQLLKIFKLKKNKIICLNTITLEFEDMKATSIKEYDFKKNILKIHFSELNLNNENISGELNLNNKITDEIKITNVKNLILHNQIDFSPLENYNNANQIVADREYEENIEVQEVINDDYQQEFEKVIKKKYIFIFKENNFKQLIIEKINNDKFFRIDKTNRYNNKIKKIVKYMVLSKKYSENMIEEILTYFYKYKK